MGKGTIHLWSTWKGGELFLGCHLASWVQCTCEADPVRTQEEFHLFRVINVQTQPMKKSSIDIYNHIMGLFLSRHVDKAIFRQNEDVNNHPVPLEDGPQFTGMDRLGNMIHKHRIEIHLGDISRQRCHKEYFIR